MSEGRSCRLRPADSPHESGADRPSCRRLLWGHDYGCGLDCTLLTRGGPYPPSPGPSVPSPTAFGSGSGRSPRGGRVAIALSVVAIVLAVAASYVDLRISTGIFQCTFLRWWILADVLDIRVHQVIPTSQRVGCAAR